jgi:bis(5'-nucleosyl)-tetraphosphatase (symmetrical)
MSNYAIGDVQGCYRELNELLILINFDPSDDTLWFCGDLVNRGPESLECLKLIHSIKNNCSITLGNHDLNLIAVANGILEPSKNDTIDQILQNQDRDLYIEWLKSIPLLHKSKVLTETGERIFVMTHAGIPPHWSLNDAIKFSEEISSVLRSKTNCIPFLKTMYGDYPDQYNKDLKTEERLRLNTNYLTRMRFCNQEGKLEFTHKGESNKPPEGYKPWFDNDLRIMQESVHLLFGHWAALHGETGIENITALDTGCIWGGKLTAFNLEEGRVFSCNRLN